MFHVNLQGCTEGKKIHCFHQGTLCKRSGLVIAVSTEFTGVFFCFLRRGKGGPLNGWWLVYITYVIYMMNYICLYIYIIQLYYIHVTIILFHYIYIYEYVIHVYQYIVSYIVYIYIYVLHALHLQTM